LDLAVDLDGLEAFKALIDRAGSDATSIRKYWGNNAGINFLGEGIINLVRSSTAP
jgi:hypothetical protein